MSDSGRVAAPKEALAEALVLSGEILRDLELGTIPITNAALKCIRLARLLNDFDAQTMFENEAGGYTGTEEGLAQKDYEAALRAGRRIQGVDKTGSINPNMVYTESIAGLEQLVRTFEASLSSARDPDVSLQSANPNQMLFAPMGNKQERQSARMLLTQTTSRLASRRTLIYRYALEKHYELKLSGIADDVFQRTRLRVDAVLGSLVPEAVQRLTAVYDNLQSDNPEDWSNAVHGCRRLLQALADRLFPATSELRTIGTGSESRSVKLGPDQYINRLMAYVSDRAGSTRFAEIVGSHLGLLGDRLDAVFKAAQKGSHADIVSREEADRYVVYTYLLIGDILSLEVHG